MGVIRLARLMWWPVRMFLYAYVLVSALMLAWTFLWPMPNADAMRPSDAIVCLGGGMDARGTLAQATLTRVDRCVQLYEAGLAPVVVFSGGTRSPDGPSAGGQMARYAMSLGLPQSAAVIEGAAQSTLQNALFSLALLPEVQRVLVVTEAFHLPRSYASFRWAGWMEGNTDISYTLAASEQVRRNPVTGYVGWHILMRESLAIWFNLARATLYTVSPNRQIDWLH